MNDALTRLEHERLANLRQLVATRALDVPAPSRRAWRPSRRFVAAASLATAAAVSIAVAASHGAAPPASAKLTGFAVQRAPDGVVTITLTDYRHPSQLSSQLQADGIPAMVVYIPAGEYCEEPDAAVVNGPVDYHMPDGLYTIPQFDGAPNGGWRMQINPSHLKPGQSLIFGISDGPDKVVMVGNHAIHEGGAGSSTYLVTGTLTACQYHPAPPPETAEAGKLPRLKKGQTLWIAEGDPADIRFGQR